MGPPLLVRLGHSPPSGTRSTPIAKMSQVNWRRAVASPLRYLTVTEARPASTPTTTRSVATDSIVPPIPSIPGTPKGLSTHDVFGRGPGWSPTDEIIRMPAAPSATSAGRHRAETRRPSGNTSTTINSRMNGTTHRTSKRRALTKPPGVPGRTRRA